MEFKSINDFAALFSVIAVFVAWSYKISADNKQSRLSNDEVSKRIDSLIKSLDRLTDKLEIQRGEVNELRERVAKVESSSSSAHKRIDDIKRGDVNVVR